LDARRDWLAWRFEDCRGLRVTGVWVGPQHLETGPITNRDATVAVLYRGEWTYRLAAVDGQVAYAHFDTDVTYDFAINSDYGSTRDLTPTLRPVGWHANFNVGPGLGQRLPALSPHPLQVKVDSLRGPSGKALRSVRDALAGTLVAGEADLTFWRLSGCGRGTSPPDRGSATPRSGRRGRSWRSASRGGGSSQCVATF
jgi:hypothetical protein